MSNIYEFYKTTVPKAIGACQYIYPSGSRMGSKCSEETKNVYCDHHSRRVVTVERALKFLEKLNESPELLDRLLTSGSFYIIHYECDQGGCDRCYNNDQEMRANDSLISGVRHIFRTLDFWETKVKTTSQIPQVKTTSQIPQVKTSPMLPVIGENVVSWKPRILDNETPEDQIVVDVVPFGDGKYRDINTGFVVDSECNFYGVSQDRVTIQSPTQSELDKAREMGFRT